MDTWRIAVRINKKASSNGHIKIKYRSFFKKEGDIKPHLIRYWLHPQIDDLDEFNKNVKTICDAYKQAIENFQTKGIHTVSTDEKTGIQALGRIYGGQKHVLQGMVAKREFDYKRHGTLCLIANMEVATGQIISSTIGETRTEADYGKHIDQTIKADESAGWIFIQDNLNTHMSETLVKYVAKACNIKEGLGKKGKSGILKSKQTRKDFLENKEHRIRFIFTPKHCSWLNQIEIWFSILAKKVLLRGDFKSKEILSDKLLKFIEFFNRTLAKPFKWTYEGKPLKA